MKSGKWMSKLDIALNHIEVQISMLQRKECVMNMLGSIPLQKFCFYHLPTRGRAIIKLGDADTSPTYP